MCVNNYQIHNVAVTNLSLEALVLPRLHLPIVYKLGVAINNLSLPHLIWSTINFNFDHYQLVLVLRHIPSQAAYSSCDMELGTTMSAGQADNNVPGFPLPGAAPDILERAYKVVKHIHISICQVLGPHKASKYHDDLLTFLCPTSTSLQRNLARDSIEGLIVLHTDTPSKLALLHNIFASYVHYEAFHLPRIPCKKLSVEGNLMLDANMDGRLGINEEFRRSAGINGVEKTWRDAMSHASPYICDKLIKAADRARKSRDVADLESALNDMNLFGGEDQVDSLADELGGVGIL